ncbi:MAG TPA: metallophosphoesterase, partial [Pyrinomonadaceae bacterium]
MKRRKKRILLLAATVAVIGLLLLGYSYFIEPRRLVINQQTLAIHGWDPAFNGFKIVAIGDIHAGSNAVDEAKLREIVKLTNRQNADLVVLLGDYVSQASTLLHGKHALKMPLETIAENLAGLTAKYGVVVVTGNHD